MKNLKLKILLMEMGIVALVNQHTPVNANHIENSLDEEFIIVNKKLPKIPNLEQPPFFQELKDEEKKNMLKINTPLNPMCLTNFSCKPNHSCIGNRGCKK